MELLVRNNLSKKSTPPLTDDVNQSIIEDEGVQFYWSIIGADWEEESSATFLEMVVSQWVKI